MPHGVNIGPVGTTNNDVDDKGPGGALNQLPSLKQTGEQQRAAITSFNEFKDGDNLGYGVTHSHAQSDGDEHGRGNVSNMVGTKTDKMKKDMLLYSSGNKYKPGNGYNNNNYSEEYW